MSVRTSVLSVVLNCYTSCPGVQVIDERKSAISLTSVLSYGTQLTQIVHPLDAFAHRLFGGSAKCVLLQVQPEQDEFVTQT